MQPVSEYNEHYIQCLSVVLNTKKNKKLNPNLANLYPYPLHIWVNRLQWTDVYVGDKSGSLLG